MTSTKQVGRAVWAVLVGCALAVQGGPNRRPPAKQANWPQWRGPQRDGISSETRWLDRWPQSGPKLQRTADVGGGFSGVAVVGERLYTMGFTRQDKAQAPHAEDAAGVDQVWCLNRQTGKVLWRHTYPAHRGRYYGPFMTPTVGGDRVYTLGKSGELRCLTSASGRLVWRRHLVNDLKGKQPYYGYASCPLVVGRLLIVATGGQAALAALRKDTGEFVWRAGQGGQTGYSCPVAYDAEGTTAVTVLTPGGAFAVDAETGRQRWRHPWGKGPNSSVTTPVVAGRRVFVSASEQKKSCALLEVADGKAKVVWENDHMLNYFNASVLWEGHPYGVHSTDHHSRNSSLRCVDVRTGAIRWTEAGVGLGGVTLAGGKLLVLTEKGELIVAAATPSRYGEISCAKVIEARCWTPPVLCRGLIYCRNHRGRLVCVDARPG